MFFRKDNVHFFKDYMTKIQHNHNTETWILKTEAGPSYQFSGISTQSHIWVQFLQNKVVPLFQLIPQDLALDQVNVCHVRNVPHTPRNNKTWRKWAYHSAEAHLPKLAFLDCWAKFRIVMLMSSMTTSRSCLGPCWRTTYMVKWSSMSILENIFIGLHEGNQTVKIFFFPSLTFDLFFCSVPLHFRLRHHKLPLLAPEGHTIPGSQPPPRRHPN